jgi:hypothetical protein
MAISHRVGDSRACGAKTVIGGNQFVTINGHYWAVDGDNNSHGGGALITSNSWLTISNSGIIVVGDSAVIDALFHPDPASSGDGMITVTSS